MSDKKQFFQEVKELLRGNLEISKIKEPLLIRHFLHNEKNGDRFSGIVEHIVPVIIQDKEGKQNNIDGSNKRKLLDYFQGYVLPNHTDIIINILHELYDNSLGEPIKRKIGLFLEHLPTPHNIDSLFNLGLKLLSEEDAMIKEFTIQGLSKFVNDFSLEQNKELINKMFYTEISKEDITQRLGTLGVTFQAKDLADASFRSSADFLGKCLQNPARSMEMLPIFMNIYEQVIQKELYSEDANYKIRVHATWWIFDTNIDSDRRQYESDPAKRLLIELRSALRILQDASTKSFESMCLYIIDKGEYIGYMEILINILAKKNNDNIIKAIVMNPEIMKAADLNKRRWYSIFNNYLEQHTSDIAKFISIVNDINIREKAELQEHIKAEAYFTIPEEHKTAEIKKYIENYEERIRREHNLPDRKMTSPEESSHKDNVSRRPSKSIDEERFKKERNVDELVNYLVAESKGDERFFLIGDRLANRYGEYFVEHPNKLESFYNQIKQKHPELKIAPYLSRYQVDSYKEMYKYDMKPYYDNLIKLLDLFQDDTESRISIARAFDDDHLRSEQTLKLKEENPKLFKRIADTVILFCNDSDPEKDSEYIGLNSVRGIGIRLCAVLIFYYPNEESLIAKIRELADDPIDGIRATVIENLPLLIRKRYDVCEEIIKKFEDDRNPTIDFSMVRYIFRLGTTKLTERVDLVRKLFNSKDQNILSELGVLVGQVLTHKVKWNDIVDDIIAEKIGSPDTVERFALQLENEIPHILEAEDRKDMIQVILPYYNKLLTEYSKDNMENHRRIAHRLSFLFYGDELDTKHFEILQEYKIFETMIEYGELAGQANLNKYLLRCVQENKNLINEMLLLLKAQVTKRPTIVNDLYLSKEIATIIEYIIKEKDRSQIVDEIFDEGLKSGGDHFYKIFEKYYNNSK